MISWAHYALDGCTTQLLTGEGPHCNKVAEVRYPMMSLKLQNYGHEQCQEMANPWNVGILQIDKGIAPEK